MILEVAGGRIIDMTDVVYDAFSEVGVSMQEADKNYDFENFGDLIEIQVSADSDDWMKYEDLLFEVADAIDMQGEYEATIL